MRFKKDISIIYIFLYVAFVIGGFILCFKYFPYLENSNLLVNKENANVWVLCLDIAYQIVSKIIVMICLLSIDVCIALGLFFKGIKQ